MDDSSNTNVIFSFKEDSEKGECPTVDKNNLVASKDDWSCSESENSYAQLSKMDLYDRLDFNRIEVKRNSRKVKTGVCLNNFTIEKFTEEITKITETLKLEVIYDMNSPNFKKRTIRFANKRVTYQYPKEVTVLSEVKDYKYSTDNLSITRSANKDSV